MTRAIPGVSAVCSCTTSASTRASDSHSTPSPNGAQSDGDDPACVVDGAEPTGSPAVEVEDSPPGDAAPLVQAATNRDNTRTHPQRRLHLTITTTEAYPATLSL
jgi:hypothetical protein